MTSDSSAGSFGQTATSSASGWNTVLDWNTVADGRSRSPAERLGPAAVASASRVATVLNDTALNSLVPIAAARFDTDRTVDLRGFPDRRIHAVASSAAASTGHNRSDSG